MLGVESGDTSSVDVHHDGHTRLLSGIGVALRGATVAP